MRNSIKEFIAPMLQKKLLISVAGLVLLIGLIGYEATKSTVHLVANGEDIKVRTHANTVQEVLLEQEIEVKKGDILVPAKNTKVFENMNIAWEAANKVTINQNGKKKTFVTHAKTVQELLAEQKLVMGKNDEVKPSLASVINKGMEIKIERAFPVTVFDGKEKKEVLTTSTTVADLLERKGIDLGKLDRVEPGLNETVSPDSKVNVIRVEKVTDVVEEPVDYATVTRADTSMVSGNKRVIEPGEKGLVEKHYEVLMENGKEISRKLIKTETVKESKDRIVAVGTRTLRPLVARGGETVKEFYVKSTAYTAYCPGCSGTTYTGINLRKNPHLKVIAVDPDVIPLGTKVWVEGYGYALAADIGSAIQGNKIDLFIPDQEKADDYGVKTVKIKILK